MKRPSRELPEAKPGTGKPFYRRYPITQSEKLPFWVNTVMLGGYILSKPKHHISRYGNEYYDFLLIQVKTYQVPPIQHQCFHVRVFQEQAKQIVLGCEPGQAALVIGRVEIPTRWALGMPGADTIMVVAHYVMPLSPENIEPRKWVFPAARYGKEETTAK